MAHRFTRAPLAAMAAAVLAAAPLGAQWQGVVTYQHQQNMKDESVPSQMQYMQGPGGMAKMVIQDKESGSTSIIYNKSQNTATLVMDSQQMYTTMPLDKMQAQSQTALNKMKITDTGKTEVIAGHTCTVYHAVDPDDQTETDACIATDMGNFMLLDVPGRGQHASRGSKIFSIMKNMLGSKDGMFPLKLTTTKNGATQEVFVATSIKAQSLPASEFTPPAGYKAMGGPGMGGPN